MEGVWDGMGVGARITLLKSRTNVLGGQRTKGEASRSEWDVSKRFLSLGRSFYIASLCVPDNVSHIDERTCNSDPFDQTCTRSPVALESV